MPIRIFMERTVIIKQRGEIIVFYQRRTKFSDSLLIIFRSVKPKDNASLHDKCPIFSDLADHHVIQAIHSRNQTKSLNTSN